MARRTAKARRGSPWKPPALAELSGRELSGLKYVVVEERVDDTIGLLVSDWPRGGAGGQPVFGADCGEEEVCVDRLALQRRLAKRRIPKSVEPGGSARATRQALRQRDVVVGDVYAIRLAAGGDPQQAVDEIGIERWIEDVIDITAEGRESAKAATYEALTPPLKQDVVKALRRKRDRSSR